MYGQRRRKKRPMHCVKTVEVSRGKNGYGFTISGQEPCILSCIVNGSPAERAGLRTGDYLISVNGMNVATASHDDVVRLIGSSSGVLLLQIAENGHSSDSSDSEYHTKPKSKYNNRRGHRSRRDDAPSGDRRAGEAGKQSVHRARDVYRSVSPTNREVEAYFNEYAAHHRHPEQRIGYRTTGIENVDPYEGEPYAHRRVKHASTGQMNKHGRPQNRHTKHTIITREHRLGLTKSASISDGFGVRHLLPTSATPLMPTNHERHLSTSSSSSANTYLPMAGRVAQPSREVRHCDLDQPDASRRQVEDEDDLDNVELPGNLRVVVGYVGSVEMPRETRLSARLQSIRSAVRRLQVERKVHTMVLMVVTFEGVTLVNTMGNTVAVYPATKLTFSGVNLDDKRFFGIVTSQGDTVGDNEGSLGGACHVFMVDPDLSVHTVHASKARHFGIQCTIHAQSQRCMEFPKSATVIVTCISRLYHDRPGGAYESGMARLSAFSQPVPTAQRHDSTASSNSDSGLGLATGEKAPGVAEAQPANGQVYVVELGQGHDQSNQSASSVLSTMDPSNNSSNNSSTLQGISMDITDVTGNSSQWNASVNSAKLQDSGARSSLQNKNTSFTSYHSISSNQNNHSGLQSPIDQTFFGAKSLDGANQSYSSTVLSAQDLSMTELNNGGGKFDVRAMPNPKGFADKSDSWKNLLEDQNSAENLRRSMRKFLAVNKGNESDAESVKSLDLAFEHVEGHSKTIPGSSDVDSSPPQPMDVDHSPPPPLPSRGMRGSSSGPNLQTLQPTIRVNPNRLSPRVFPNTGSADGIARPKTHSDSAVIRSLDVDTQYMPPPPPLQPSHPTTKPPVPPSILKTPQRRVQAERPKSTPPIRGASRGMEVDYDSDPNELSSFADTLDVTKDVAMIKSEVNSSGVLGRRYQKGQAVDTQSSFRRLNKNKLSSSVESLVVNNNEAEVGAHIGENATSVTVITSHGVLSYQQGGSIPIGRAAGWAVNFDRLLRDKVGLATFTEFLKKEFSEENIVFWKKCEEYRKITDEKERRALAGDIYKKHVTANAPEAVNIDSQCMTSLSEVAIQRAATDLFDTAKKQIFQLMKQDSYPRFLKSDLYKTSVKAEIDCQPLPFSEESNGHVAQPDAVSTGSRESIGKKSKFLKKSQSGSVEEGSEKRRRSLLPWGKKDKSKIAGRGNSEADLVRHNKERVSNGSSTYGKKSVDATQLNELRQLAQENGEAGSKDDTCSVDEQNQKFLRVALPDGSSTVIYAKPSTTVRAAIAKLCERRNLDINMVDVYSQTTGQIIDLSRDVSRLGTKEIILEPRIVFRVDLPNKKSLGIKAPGHQHVRKALSPVLQRYGFKLDSHVLHEFGSSNVLDADTRVTDVQNKRIGVFLAEDFPEWGGFGPHRSKPVLTKQLTEPAGLGSSLTKEDTQDQQFEDLFNGDVELHSKFDLDGVLDFDRKDDKTSKEENRMSGLFSNLLRKNSMDGKDGGKVKAKRGVQKSNSKTERVLPARTRNDNEDFKVFALLSKVSSQFDDQRGPLRKQDLELPDFLKPKAGESLMSASNGSAMEFPLRKTEMHSSDTSLYDPNSEEKGNLELTRTLSNSEERLDNLLMKQFRGSSRNKGGYSIRSSYAVHSTDMTPSKFPYMDASFSSDGVLPTPGAAEDLFASGETASPDFNRSGLMEKSRVEFGGARAENAASRDRGENQVRPSVYRELIPPVIEPVNTHSSAHKNKDGFVPVPAPRRKHSTKRSKQCVAADAESQCSDVSSATQSSGGFNSTNSSDLDNTLLPPSDDSDIQSTSGVHRVQPLPTTPRGVLNLDPNRQKYFPATRSSASKLQGALTSPMLKRPLKEQSISWAMQQGRQAIPQSPLPHASYRAPSRGSTPSPTTHDLVLLPESSPDDASDDVRAPIPAPRRSSLNRKANTSLENVVERGAAAQKRVQKLRQQQSSDDENVQVSYV